MSRKSILKHVQKVSCTENLVWKFLILWYKKYTHDIAAPYDDKLRTGCG